MSVDKLVTAMKDRGFVLASTTPHQSSPHFPPEQAHFHHPSSPPHHLPPPVQTLPPKTATDPMQRHDADRAREGERERARQTAPPPSRASADRARGRAREGERESERQTASPPSGASAGPTARTKWPPSLPSQVTGPPPLPPFPAPTGGATTGGAKKRIKAMLRRWKK